MIWHLDLLSNDLFKRRKSNTWPFNHHCLYSAEVSPKAKVVLTPLPASASSSSSSSSRRSSGRNLGVHELSACEQLTVDLVRNEDSWPFKKLVSRTQVKHPCHHNTLHHPWLAQSASSKQCVLDFRKTLLDTQALGQLSVCLKMSFQSRMPRMYWESVSVMVPTLFVEI